MPDKSVGKGSFRDRMKTLMAPPTPNGRLKNAGVDFLLSVLALQVSNQFDRFGSNTLAKVEPLLDRSSVILHSGQTITASQLQIVEALHHNVKLMFGQVETANVASWALMGLIVVATVQLLYNGVQATIQTIKNLGNV